MNGMGQPPSGRDAITRALMKINSASPGQGQPPLPTNIGGGLTAIGNSIGGMAQPAPQQPGAPTSLAPPAFPTPPQPQMQQPMPQMPQTPGAPGAAPQMPPQGPQGLY